MTPGETLARLSRGVFSVKGAGEGGGVLGGLSRDVWLACCDGWRCPPFTCRLLNSHG